MYIPGLPPYTFVAVRQRRGVDLDEHHQQVLQLYMDYLRTRDNGAGEHVDIVLNKCPHGVEYCDQCAVIFCPFGETLHFHHDGCPCCDTPPGDEATREQWIDHMTAYHGVKQENRKPEESSD